MASTTPKKVTESAHSHAESPGFDNRVENRHIDYKDNFSKWELIYDVLAGSSRVKQKREKYLPRPDPDDNSEAGKKRYNAYVTRALFYGVANRTLQGLVGHVFSKQTSWDLPPRLANLVDNIDGEGATLDQFAKKQLGRALSQGRGGIWVDYPKRDSESGPATVAELDSGQVRPKLLAYSCFDITNWRTTSLGAISMLSLVVLRETYEVDNDPDGFGSEPGLQYRVLRLNMDNPQQPVYTVEIWRKSEDDKAGWKVVEGPIVPTDSSGRPFSQIPFIPFGWETNTISVDEPPLYDLCDLNLTHYRNSADYQESVYLVGQPQMVFSGITKDWIDEVWRGKGVQFGSRTALSLPRDASSKLEQAQPNTLAFESLQHTEKQMVALGAELIEQKQVQQTATQNQNEEAIKVSVLSSSANNISDAITQALVLAGQFIGEEQGIVKQEDGIEKQKIFYELNTDFDVSKMDAQERAQLIKEYQGQMITWSEVRTALKAAGVAYQPDEAARTEIENDPNNIAPPSPFDVPPSGSPFGSEEEEESES